MFNNTELCHNSKDSRTENLDDIVNYKTHDNLSVLYLWSIFSIYVCKVRITKCTPEGYNFKVNIYMKAAKLSPVQY